MANIFDRYGIKEVADVTFYNINDDETRGAPVLYLDTLKVSTIEQTAESAEARGGKGNAALISWDFGKEITVTLEDALFSPRSLALMYGDGDATPATLNSASDNIYKTLWKETAKIKTAPTGGTTSVEVEIGGKAVTLSSCSFYDAQGNTVDYANCIYFTGKMPYTNASKIEISANNFPGTYYITGDTFVRNEITGKDEFFQFVIPKAKVMSETNTITMEAEGDPTVFSMSLKVLRPRDGVMMSFIQYKVD